MTKLAYTKEVVTNQGVPHIRWNVTDKSTGVVLASTITRKEARNFVNKRKVESRVQS